ncbi:MAG: hypothetical protein ACO3L7_00455 [Poseidonia sp.]
MGLVRSVFFGSMAWVGATSMMVHPEMALGFAIVVAFISESTHHRGELRRMRRQANDVSTQLRAANLHVEDLQRALTQRHLELNKAIDELQRRDAVGSPAARELLKRQEEAMTAASRALEARQERNDVVFNSMERLLNVQVEQTAKMQEAMGNLLQHLISQPRGHFTMNDSVMVSEGGHEGDVHQRHLRDINEWLRLQSASSP